MSWFSGMSRAEMADEAGFQFIHCKACGFRDYAEDGCPNCSENAEEEAWTVKYKIARKARTSRFTQIRVGDLIRVTTGFTYKKGGERTGYLSPRVCAVMHGPAWEDYDAVAFGEEKRKKCWPRYTRKTPILVEGG